MGHVKYECEKYRGEGLRQEAKSDREEQGGREERRERNQRMKRRRQKVYNYILKQQLHIKTTTTFVVGCIIWLLESGERMSTGRSFI